MQVTKVNANRSLVILCFDLPSIINFYLVLDQMEFVRQLLPSRPFVSVITVAFQSVILVLDGLGNTFIVCRTLFDSLQVIFQIGEIVTDIGHFFVKFLVLVIFIEKVLLVLSSLLSHVDCTVSPEKTSNNRIR